MTLRELRRTWIGRAAELEPYAPAAAVAYRRAADELATALDETDDTATVTLKEAHEIGGYSIDHLQRLVASGQLTNVGSKGRFRIRRSAVPVKPGHNVLRTPTDDRHIRPSAVVASAIARSAQ